MGNFSIQQLLIDRVARELGSATADDLVAQIAKAGGDGNISSMAAVLTLFDELEQVSPKAARAAIEALPELDRRAGLVLARPWLDLGVALAESSGAAALKYFKDSPLILGVIEPPQAQAAVLAIALELADHDANVTLEYLRSATQILAVVPAERLRPWLDIGVELTQVNVVVGLEYIRQIPILYPVLPLEEIRCWLSLGMQLIAPNSLGKPDYMATMEFLRMSPAILADIEHAVMRGQVVRLGALLAGQSPQTGVAWLGESARILRALPSCEWQGKVLGYGSLLGEQDPEATLSYLRRCPEIIALIGDVPQTLSRFESWFKAGMEVLTYSREGARAYFALESQRALTSVEEALSGVPLRRVARKLKLFVQGLCGVDLSITALPDSVGTSAARATVSADGRTIALPAMLRRYPTATGNERLYLVMVAHEAGHVEFGTYRLRFESLADLIDTVRRRYGRPLHEITLTLADFFRLYPHPRLAQDLWMVLEDARVEFLLQEEYPGLRRELALLASESITPRDPAHGLTVKELIVDCLLRLSTGESEASAVPHAIKEEVSELWILCQRILARMANAEDTVRVAHEVYVRMEELLAPRADMIQLEYSNQDVSEVGVGPTASEETGDGYRPVTNWVYRGAMSPDFIKRDSESAAESPTGLEQVAGRSRASQEEVTSNKGGGGDRQDSSMSDVLGEGRALPSIADELLALEVEQSSHSDRIRPGERAVRYPEWDHAIQDYRMNWCCVTERPAESGSDESVASTLLTHQSAIKSLRRFFESLRPPAFRRVTGQTDGDDLDIDAVVRRAGEQLAGAEGGDRIYIRREKKERNVAVAVLVDVSGSTGRQVESGRRVIDIEKESLVLLCEALDAVGDLNGLYAYSGQGRANVDFLTIKNFDEPLGSAIAHRLGGLAPRQQNRDGAAIRHAVAKLRRCEVKTRILLLVSDGRPLDGDYKDEYSLEDTKAALKEAKRHGIEPFCVTIDGEADGYLRRMYGDVQYMVIDRAEALPLRLPRLYQRLTT